jgi:hypothetical protein
MELRQRFQRAAGPVAGGRPVPLQVLPVRWHPWQEEQIEIRVVRTAQPDGATSPIKGKKIMKISTLVALVLGLGAFTISAQAQPGGGPGGPGGPRGGGRPPMPPIIATLDVNTNSVLEASEIANASKALLKLDLNSDGKLSADELKPQAPSGGNGQQFTPPGGGKFPTLPAMKALDTDGDGELSASEIAKAPAALATLDTDGDGQLSRDELMPRPPQGAGGPGGENPPPGQ